MSSAQPSSLGLLERSRLLVEQNRAKQKAEREKERLRRDRANTQGIGAAVITENRPLLKSSKIPQPPPAPVPRHSAELSGDGRPWKKLILPPLANISSGASMPSGRRRMSGRASWSSPIRLSASQADSLALSRALHANESPNAAETFAFQQIAEERENGGAFANNSGSRSLLSLSPALLAPLLERRLAALEREGARVATTSAQRRKSIENTELDLDLMSLLDLEHLEALRAGFAARQRPLSLEEFLDMTLPLLPVNLLGSVRMAAFLCEFFASVDINSDASIEWSELTGFISEQGENRHSAAAAQHRKQEIPPYQGSLTQDRGKYEGRIGKMFYFADLDHLIISQTGSPKFLVKRGKTLADLCNVHGHASELESAEFIPGLDFTMTAANDRVIRAWDAKDYYRLMPFQIANPDRSAFALRYSPANGLFFSAGESNIVRTWKFDERAVADARGSAKAALFQESAKGNSKAQWKAKGSEVSCAELRASMVGAGDLILDLLMIESMASIAAASLDHQIHLFDVNTGQRTASLTGHRKGVHKLAYSSSYHCLISAAFEHSAVVWNPYCESQICRLTGHYSPLIGVEAIPDSPQLISADSGGVIKIWDMRNFSCLQTFSVESDSDPALGVGGQLVAMPQHRRLAVSGPGERPKVFLFDSLNSTRFHEPIVADTEAPSDSALLNQFTGQFVTTHGRSVKLWQSESGAIEKIYRDLSGDLITACCFDEGEKKIILGEQSGAIVVCNLLSGARLKFVHVRPSFEVSFLHFVPRLNHILAARRNGELIVFEERNEEIRVVKQVIMANSECSAADFSQIMGLFAMGASDGGISLYDDRASLNLGELKAPANKRHKINDKERENDEPSSEITALAFLSPFPLLAAADADHNLLIFQVRPLQGRCILRLKHSAVINALVFSPFTRSLYAGDSSGFIACWSLNSAIETIWQLAPLNEESMQAKYRKNHPHRELQELVIGEEQVTLSAQWRAHSEAVKRLTVGHAQAGAGANFERFAAHEESSVVGSSGGFLISAGYDRRILLWSLNIPSEPLGALEQGRSEFPVPGLTPWLFPSDTRGRQARREETAKKVLKQINKSKQEKNSHEKEQKQAEEEKTRLALPPILLSTAIAAAVALPRVEFTASTPRESARALRDSYRKENNLLQLPSSGDFLPSSPVVFLTEPMEFS